MSSEPTVVGTAPVSMNGSGQDSRTARDGGLGATGGPPGMMVKAGRGTHASDRLRDRLLARALEAEVIPRLVLARDAGGPGATSRDAGANRPTQEDFDQLTQSALRGDVGAGLALVARLRSRNVPLEAIYLELLAPVARHLGALWEADLCDFTQVSVGLCALQQIVLEQEHAPIGRRPRSLEAVRSLLAPTPGEQHSFGLVLVGEMFRRKGWEVSSATGASSRELVALVRKQHFDIVGLSLACEDRLGALAGLIRDLRRATRNARLGILVGGQVFLERPELAALVGADATAADAQQAVQKTEILLTWLTGQE